MQKVSIILDSRETTELHHCLFPENRNPMRQRASPVLRLLRLLRLKANIDAVCNRDHYTQKGRNCHSASNDVLIVRYR